MFAAVWRRSGVPGWAASGVRVVFVTIGMAAERVQTDGVPVSVRRLSQVVFPELSLTRNVVLVGLATSAGDVPRVGAPADEPGVARLGGSSGGELRDVGGQDLEPDRGRWAAPQVDRDHGLVAVDRESRLAERLPVGGDIEVLEVPVGRPGGRGVARQAPAVVDLTAGGVEDRDEPALVETVVDDLGLDQVVGPFDVHDRVERPVEDERPARGPSPEDGVRQFDDVAVPAGQRDVRGYAGGAAAGAVIVDARPAVPDRDGVRLCRGWEGGGDAHRSRARGTCRGGGGIRGMARSGSTPGGKEEEAGEAHDGPDGEYQCPTMRENGPSHWNATRTVP